MIKMSKMHKRLCAKSAAMLALSAALPIGSAYADEAAADAAPAASQLETVTVTAQRRKENIRDVPVSVSMLTAQKLDVIVSGG